MKYSTAALCPAGAHRRVAIRVPRRDSEAAPKGSGSHGAPDARDGDLRPGLWCRGTAARESSAGTFSSMRAPERPLLEAEKYSSTALLETAYLETAHTVRVERRQRTESGIRVRGRSKASVLLARLLTSWTRSCPGHGVRGGLRCAVAAIASSVCPCSRGAARRGAAERGAAQMGDAMLNSTQSLSASCRGISREVAAHEARVRVDVQHCRPLALSLFNPPFSAASDSAAPRSMLAEPRLP